MVDVGLEIQISHFLYYVRVGLVFCDKSQASESVPLRKDTIVEISVTPNNEYHCFMKLRFRFTNRITPKPNLPKRSFMTNGFTHPLDVNDYVNVC